jgi:acid phosphatase type 7
MADTATDPVIAAAGDIACDPAGTSFNGGLGTRNSCRQKYTSDLLVGANLAGVLSLGDNQYECAGRSAFLQSFDLSWGRVKSLIHPATGNHEYYSSGGTDCDATGGAGGYFSYFGAAAGDPSKGYYSYDIGAWHLIALNSNCSQVGGCGAGSSQETWLRSDLAVHTNDCTLAYWHHARFSSGSRGSDPRTAALWTALYEAGADLVLTAHDHHYERFAPQDPKGNLDLSQGIPEFVVGTGGKNRSGLVALQPNSEVQNTATFGVVKLTLHPTGYDFQFAPEAGKVFTDTGSGACHGAPAGSPDTTAPTAPTNLSAVARSSTQIDLAWSAATDNVGVTGYELYRDGALLQTLGVVTSAVDTTVTAGKTYSYTVRARDAAGNWSAFSSSASATTPAADATTRTFAAEADARVQESAPLTNYGTSYLRADGGSDLDVESYLRFAVSDLAGSVTSAKLRLYAYTGTGNGPAAYSTGNTWSETGLTWSNRPARTSGPTDDKGAIAATSWVEYDVTSFVSGNGTYSFALATSSSDGIDFYQREAASLQPELVVTATAAP